MDIVYVVTCSFFSQVSQGEHFTDTKVFHNETDCKEYFMKKYNEMLDTCKGRCDNVITFWDAYKKQELPPKTGKYIFAFDMFENNRSVEYIEDGKVLISYNIVYAGMLVV